MMAKDIGRFKRFTKKDVCNGTVLSLKKVNYCPKNKIQHQERSQNMPCESYPLCLGEPLVYHCVILEEGLVEVCAPRNQITGRCCAVFDRRLGRVREDYSLPCSECPFKYQSDDYTKYVSCVPKAQTSTVISKVNKITNVTTNSNTSRTTNSRCCKGARCKRNVNVCTEPIFDKKINESKSFRNEHYSTLEDFAIKLTPAILIICVAISIPYSCYRIYSNNKDKADNTLHVSLIENQESVTEPILV